jgi:DNA-binding transcriptional LysR family regulator
MRLFPKTHLFHAGLSYIHGMPSLPDLEAWAIFARVADKGSFSLAAQELGLAKTTVSKAITRLEQRIGSSLLHRTTRKLSLTEAGRSALDRARRILADGTAIEADMLEEAAAPRGIVRLACTSGFGIHSLAPALPDFMRAYPDVLVDLTLADDQVDVVAGGYDLAIRIGQGADSSLLSSRLFSFRRPLVAAEASVAVRPKSAFRSNNAAAMVPAAVAGLGLTLLPEYFVWRELEQGMLVQLLPDWTAPAAPIHLVTPPGTARPARVRVLLDFLRERFASRHWGQGIER